MRFTWLMIGMGICGALVGLGVPVASGAISQIAFEEMIPEDALFYISVPDAAQLVAKFKESNAYKILQGIDPVALIKGAPEFERAKRFYMTFAQPLTEIFHGRIALVVNNIPAGGAMPGIILLADVGDREEKLRQYFAERIHPFLESAGVPTLSFKQGEYEVRQFSFAKPAPFVACYAIADGVFVATMGRQTMEELLTRPRREKSLADNPVFQDVRRKVGEKSEFLVYANISAFLETVPALPGKVNGILEASGLLGVKALGVGVDILGPAAKLTCFLATGPERKGLLGIVAREAPPLKVVGYVPEDVTFMSTIWLGDLDQLWDELMGVLRQTLQAAGDERDWERMVAALKRWEDRQGTRIKEDILSPFSGELSVAVRLPEVMGIPQVLLFMEVKDAQRAKAVVEKLIGLVERVAPGVRSVRIAEDYKGVTITSLALAPSGGGVGIAAAFMTRPAFAVVGDFLVIGLQSSAVRRVVDVHQGAKSLRDSPEFRRVLAHLPRQGNRMSYVDMREVYDFLYSAFSAIAATHIGPDIVARFGKIRPYFGCSAKTVFCDESGITCEIFSESGLAEQALVLMVPAAVIPATISAKGAAERAACANNLRQLAIACVMYANDRGSLPASLSDLYPKYVSSLEVFVCPAHRGKEISSKTIDTASDYKLEIPGANLTNIKALATTVMISEREPNHGGGRSTAYADGHVESSGGGAQRARVVPAVGIMLLPLLIMLL